MTSNGRLMILKVRPNGNSNDGGGGGAAGTNDDNRAVNSVVRSNQTLSTKRVTMALGAGLKGTMIGPTGFWSTPSPDCENWNNQRKTKRDRHSTVTNSLRRQPERINKQIFPKAIIWPDPVIDCRMESVLEVTHEPTAMARM
jgi:hypothetical protein